MNAQDKRAHNAEALQELKAIANALPALATKVDVIVRLERAERMAATINRIIQTHATDAAQTRDTMTPRELAKRIGRGENWKMVDEPAQAQAQSGECQRNSPAGCDCIDTCVAISQPQAAEPVAEVSRGVRVDGVLLHEGELNWLQNTNRPAPGTKLYTRPPAQAQAQSGEWVMVPREPTEWMLQAAEDAVNAAAHCESTTDDLSAIAYKAALAAAPQQAAEPVYQMRNGNAWFDIPRKQFARIDSVSTRVLYTTPQAGEPVGHARTDGCMHFAYLPWSVKDGDPVYAAPPAERVQEKAEPVAWMHPELHKGHPYPEECLSTEAFDGWLPLYTHPQPPAQSGASKFVHSSPESRQAVLERVAERATQAQLEQSAQCAKDAARGIDARGHGAAPAGGP